MCQARGVRRMVDLEDELVKGVGALASTRWVVGWGREKAHRCAGRVG